MVTSKAHINTLSSLFLAPLRAALAQSRCVRACRSFDDIQWLEAGVRRSIKDVQSGRDFIQFLADSLHINVIVQTFFLSLKSSRRLRLVTDIAKMICDMMIGRGIDRLEDFPSLAAFDVYATDGHFIKAAAHDKKKICGIPIFSEQPSQETLSSSTDATRRGAAKSPVGHIYSVDLRSHAVSHLSVCLPTARKHEHEIKTLKRLSIDALRMGAAVGRKVLHIYDRAVIDFRKWYEWRQSGIYILTRERTNMSLETIGQFPIDRSDTVNNGVVSDTLVATSNGISVRRVEFVAPATGETYVFLTTLSKSVPPGVVALLYRMRWDVEKVFDTFKNKMGEDKAWATSLTAKEIQAKFICLSHNLMTLLSDSVEALAGISNQPEIERRRKRSCQQTHGKARRGRIGTDPMRECLAKASSVLTQHSVKFIRWLNNHLESEAPWQLSLLRLRAAYAM